ncbi:hypothetical protein Ddye_023364 [Dipteronia dyeriana]|uniref:Uncharacterized protein n=1 Tax=Dipteronia dyeriana TaxID=168575 RepID=A0AAD9TTF1_9ROSI|nr:hypothetical protein Ddye_023364 [Dipteronia dyeriana]
MDDPDHHQQHDPILLHSCTVHRYSATVNRLYILFHFTAILCLFYYRFTNLLSGNVPMIPWSLITLAELVLTFIWLTVQSFRWLPVTRSVSLENSPAGWEAMLPGVDVFVCTADPIKEPTLGVMNTVISALALDYPTDKMAVYLSDDGGSKITFYATKEASKFAKYWIPFCTKYGIKTRNPEAYFSPLLAKHETLLHTHDQFKADEAQIKSKYEIYKSNVEKFGKKAENNDVAVERPPCVEIMHENNIDEEGSKMPLLVYVSRERRASYPHRFKAGALNTLLRVSGIMSNGPYILVLDCDMYCNDPSSARQAMCFNFDPNISPSLAYVQFPQMFYNVNDNDIYEGSGRSAYMSMWQGMDGLRGPTLSGTGYYLKRIALFTTPDQQDKHLLQPEKNFGNSRLLIGSLKAKNDKDVAIRKEEYSSDSILEEAKRLASCAYEVNTNWGKEIGYLYESLLESTFTGYILHCKGWISVYLYPKRPCFLGCSNIDMKDSMTQLMKWCSGLIDFGLSRFSPIIYGFSRMSILQSMCYAYFTFLPLFSVAMTLYGTVPQLCLLTGTPLYPKVSNSWFAVFSIVFLSSLCNHLYDVLSTGETLRTLWNEQRFWMIQSVSGNLFGCIDMLMKRIGAKKASFRISNKAMDKEKLEKYEKGKYDFEGADIYMVPMTIMVILNIVCFFGGIIRLVLENNMEDMFGQLVLSSYVLFLSYPIIEGLISSKSKEN